MQRYQQITDAQYSIEVWFYESQANHLNGILVKCFKHTFSLPCYVIYFDLRDVKDV